MGTAVPPSGIEFAGNGNVYGFSQGRHIDPDGAIMRLAIEFAGNHLCYGFAAIFASSRVSRCHKLKSLVRTPWPR